MTTHEVSSNGNVYSDYTHANHTHQDKNMPFALSLPASTQAAPGTEFFRSL